jgi:hypothetical protein
MLLLLFIWRELARHRERERERLWEPVHFDHALAWAAAAVLVVLGFAISWWVFWIGLFIVAPVVIALATSE